MYFEFDPSVFYRLPFVLMIKVSQIITPFYPLQETTAVLFSYLFIQFLDFRQPLIEQFESVIL